MSAVEVVGFTGIGRDGKPVTDGRCESEKAAAARDAVRRTCPETNLAEARKPEPEAQSYRASIPGVSTTAGQFEIRPLRPGQCIFRQSTWCHKSCPQA